jgi:hypothetical protein
MTVSLNMTNPNGCGNNFHWLMGNGDSLVSQNPVYSYVNTGTYTISLFCYTNCIGYYTISVPSSTGFFSNETNRVDLLNIYPNPSTGIFTLQKATDAKATVVVYDVLGNQWLSINLSQGEGTKQIDMSNFAKGIYHLQLLERDKVYSQKIVIQ